MNQADIQANTPAEKRALSYSATIKKLFDEVLDTKMPADRIVANYFREHKKHGSKDRRVIRETLFGLFRWWGWLKQLGSQHDEQTWFKMLSSCAILELHTWRSFAEAWQQFGQLSPSQLDIINNVLNEQLNSAAEPITEVNTYTVVEKTQLMASIYNPVAFSESQLLPDWFWEVCPISDESQKIQLIEAMSSRPPIWARAQNIDTQVAVKQLQQAGIDASASEYFADALSLGNKSINLNDVALYKQGQVEIQDLASQVIGNTCQPKADDKWWDTCSGAGGKTLQLHSLMLQNASSNLSSNSIAILTGSIVSSDIRSKALEELKKRAKRANFKGITVARWKSDDLPVDANSFDGVLVDAPCSCTGTWRRNPDMRWIDDRSCVDNKSELQLDILSRSSKAVKTGAHLVYATCSLSPIENEQVVEQFLQHNPSFDLVLSTHPFTQAQQKHVTVWPNEANSDGMYVARMVKR
ncbi:RsmB/NOP family class I SAM-dependent RNA methyltransferase [Shewanella sp. 1_MG-2023]|uniref:RsmB/NOP family class I SAM-dependent RNA methyltransferase n=1 Tax=unclassified Shewanella TaxID=196818 RepID=UPI0026E1E0C1|nr:MULTISPECIES: RsmB/NOP family class I SAM-dependent RNA methyltransferase [unclassified Shewanella]MDO6610134.1 RsmB/NOP family class I SAM-dependent RNA methyltransferase [Shewanella sp. 7_MG-2023]MDO6769724.1 RsmB/NOP family class I SAM-dependent RNA methyltransferase [Shewanella sp. 2_MG-2023]MDO6792788.1 RsmB/NOP family class I SAM-dependent RNA methyltransferase [Shewanella sp. 1_MG-2023]